MHATAQEGKLYGIIRFHSYVKLVVRRDHEGSTTGALVAGAIIGVHPMYLHVAQSLKHQARQVLCIFSEIQKEGGRGQKAEVGQQDGNRVLRTCTHIS